MQMQDTAFRPNFQRNRKNTEDQKMKTLQRQKHFFITRKKWKILRLYRKKQATPTRRRKDKILRLQLSSILYIAKFIIIF